jgi:hypothetical protein
MIECTLPTFRIFLYVLHIALGRGGEAGGEAGGRWESWDSLGDVTEAAFDWLGL